MLYTFNSFDSASKTVFTDTLEVTQDDPGPYVIAHFLAEHLRSMSEDMSPGVFYKIVAAWQVLQITVVVLQDEFENVLTIQLEP